MDMEISLRFWNAQARDSDYGNEHGPGMLIRDGRLCAQRKAAEERAFEKLVRLEPGMRVLDLGCGTGRWAFYFARRGCPVVATDFSESMIELCRGGARREGVCNAEFRVRLCDEIKDLGRFDLVFAGGVLQCLSDELLGRAVRAIAGALKGDGVLITRDTVAHRRVQRDSPFPVIYRQIEEYASVFGEQGLMQCRSVRASVIPQIVPKLLPLAPLRGRLLSAAVQLDGLLMRSPLMRLPLRLYRALSGRGPGAVTDHRFSEYRFV